MTELFLTVLQMSLMAAGVVLIALPLRWLFRRLRLPALACELLWLVAAVRMLLPVGLVTGPFSVLGWLTPAVQEQTEALARTEEIVLLPAAPDPAPPAEPAPSFALPEAVPAPEEAAPAAEGLSVLDVLAWLWLAGVLAVWGYSSPSGYPASCQAPFSAACPPPSPWSCPPTGGPVSGRWWCARYWTAPSLSWAGRRRWPPRQAC